MKVGDIVLIKSGLSSNMKGEIIAEFLREFDNDNLHQHEYPDKIKYWIIKLENGNEILAPESFLEINEQLNSLNQVGH